MTARPRLPRLLVALAAIVLVVVGGCEKVTHPSASISPCFKALGPAHAAVGGQGTLVDVARVRRDPLVTTTVPVPTTVAGALPTVPGSGRRAALLPRVARLRTGAGVCLVAYRGTFDAARITALRGEVRTGRYAVVVFGLRANVVRFVVLTDALPAPLHAH